LTACAPGIKIMRVTGPRILLLRTTPPGARKRGFGPPPCFPPLGLLHVAAGLREALGPIHVRVMDAAVDLEREEDLDTVLEAERPEIVGLSGLTHEEPLVARTARRARSWSARASIVVGGPIASSDPIGLLERIPGVDHSIVGEGDETFPDLVDAISRGRDRGSVRGIALRSGGRPVLTQRRPFVADLDALPLVDWSETDLDAYGRLYNFNDLPVVSGRYAPMVTSRGCPFRCTYCHGHFGRRARGLDPARIAEEMDRDVRRWGIREFHISDDIFNFRKGRIESFCKEIRARRLDVRLAFPNGIRGDRLTRHEVDALADAGCFALSLAVETVTKRFEQLLRKRLDLDHVFRAAEWASARGMVTRCFVMLGFPGETPEEMKATIDRVTASAFDIVHIFTVAPNPGTDLHDLAVGMGFDPRRWYGADYDYDACFVNASGLPDGTFRRIVDWARLHPYRQPERQARLRDRYRTMGAPAHPLFLAGQHWKLALGEVLRRDLERTAQRQV